MGAWNWLWKRFLTQPDNVGGTGLVLFWAGWGVQALSHSPAVKHAGGTVTYVGGFLFGLSFLIYLLKFVRRLMPRGASIAAAAMIDIAVYGFFVLIPPLLVSLVTSGGNWSEVGAAMLGKGGHGLVPDVLGGVRFACQLVTLLILIAIPAVLRHWLLPWGTASSLARSLVPSWLAAVATVLTWLYIILLHFGGGALARDPLGLIVVTGLAAALILVPVFQFVARSCWEYGFVAVFDPVRWHGAFRAVFDEVLGAHGSDVTDKRHGPGQPHQAQPQPADRAGENTAQADAVSARAPGRLPR
jgi:hypothetical protein